MNTICKLGLLTFLLAAFAILGNAQTSETKVIDKFIAQQAARYKGEEYPDARKVVSGDLNHDGVPDSAVLYTIEGQGGSNNYIQYLAVFLGHKSGLVYATNTPVGGKNRRDVDLVAINDGVIDLNTTAYGPKDPSCCPTIKGTAKYALVAGRLKETANKRQ